MDQDDVRQPVEAGPQHAHHRGDAAAAGDEQNLARRRVGKHEVADRLVEVDQLARPQLLREVRADHAVRDRLGRDGEQTVVPGAEVSEYERQSRTPSTSRPIRTY